MDTGSIPVGSTKLKKASVFVLFAQIPRFFVLFLCEIATTRSACGVYFFFVCCIICCMIFDLYEGTVAIKAMRSSGMTAEQLEAEVRKRRRSVVDEIADKDIRRSMPLDKLGENGYNGNADDDIRKAFAYTKEQYNNFGWAREVGAITSNEPDDLYSAIKIKKRLSDCPISSQNERIVEVNNKPHTTLDVSNVFVFVQGSRNNPEITRVIRAEIFSNTEMKENSDVIYGREAGDASAISAFKVFEDFGIFREFRREDLPNYTQYYQTAKQRGSQPGLPQGSGANGSGGNGGGSNRGVKQDIKNAAVYSFYLSKQRRVYVFSILSICNSVFSFDTVHFFQHRFGGYHKEYDGAEGVHQIHRQTCYVRGEKGIKIYGFA